MIDYNRYSIVYPERKITQQYVEEYIRIKNCEGYDLRKFIDSNDVLGMRLPLNNEEAYYYLRWLNDRNYSYVINYILNVFEDFAVDDEYVPVRPPTFREFALNAVERLEEAEESDRICGDHSGVDYWLDNISEAYRFRNDDIFLLNSGIAGCFLKFGTWETNKTDFKFRTYEELKEQDRKDCEEQEKKG